MTATLSDLSVDKLARATGVMRPAVELGEIRSSVIVTRASGNDPDVQDDPARRRAANDRAATRGLALTVLALVVMLIAL